MKKKLIIGILISLVFLYLAFRKVDYSELWGALKGANYWYIIPNIVLGLLSMWMRAYRWKFMVNPIKKVGLTRLFHSVMIGFMANNVLPARLGEFVRAYSLGTKESISKSATFATIVIERVFDGFSLLFILWLSLLFSPFPDWVRKASNLFLLINLALFAFLVFIEVKREPTLKLFNFIFRLLPVKLSLRAKEIMEKFIGGLKVFRNIPSLIWILGWSIVIWGVVGISNYFIFLAFNLHPPIQASFILLVIVCLGVMLPSSPGFVGTFQFFCVIALATFGYDKNIALPFSLVLHASQYLPVTLLGLYYLKKEHLSLKTLESDSMEKE
jgi:glycosyltransferase 2 family protein